jgi:serine/threonine protein kinase
MSRESDLLLARVQAATEGEYRIERELGRGGMAAVFLARDLSLERRVAIKVMLPDLMSVSGVQDRFVVEARTVAHLDHAGIVTVYSVKQRDDLTFIVMKYIDGRTLDAIMKDHRAVDLPVLASIIGQVAEALHFAHTEGIVHRDVKPSNIIIDTRGRPFVTDFGIAKVTSARSITLTGSMIGTPAYMSPEQCRGLPATAASDQYALGVLAYEILSGILPFDGSLFELIHAHSNEPPRPLNEIAPALDAEVVRTVHRMLEKNPRDRHPSLA